MGGRHLGYIGALLFANIPQLLLTLCYFSYNAIFTCLSADQEWNSFSSSSKPLRVSYPNGEQMSSYRLQLPYKYSVPLISLSTFLHWLLSNGIYLFVVEGGEYIHNSQHLPRLHSDTAHSRLPGDRRSYWDRRSLWRLRGIPNIVGLFSFGAVDALHFLCCCPLPPSPLWASQTQRRHGRWRDEFPGDVCGLPCTSPSTHGCPTELEW